MHLLYSFRHDRHGLTCLAGSNLQDVVGGSSYLRCGWTITGDSRSADVPVLFFAAESPDSMHCLSVVPDNEIIDFPAMGVDKLKEVGGKVFELLRFISILAP